jgi:hypothetical protein
MAKKKETKEKKGLTIFDHIANITYKKKHIDKYAVDDWKTFDVYMINQFLSMNIELIETVNYIQYVTIGIKSKQDMYKIYYAYLPKRKFYSKYIKADNANKYNSDLLKIISDNYNISNFRAIEYLDMYNKDIDSKLSLDKLLISHGIDKKQIKKLIKVK